MKRVRYNSGKGEEKAARSANRKSTAALVFASAALLLSGTSVAMNWDRIKATYGKAHSALVGRQAQEPEAKGDAPAKSMAAPISPPEAKEESVLEQTNEEWFEEQFGNKPEHAKPNKPPYVKMLGQPPAKAGPLKIEPWQLPDYHGKKAKKKHSTASDSEVYGSSSGEGGFAPPPTAVAGGTGKSGSLPKPKKAPATSAEEPPGGFTPPPAAVAGK